MRHIFRLSCLSSLFIPQLFIDPRTASPEGIYFLGFSLLLAVVYALICWVFGLGGRSVRLRDEACYLPFLLPVCCSMLPSFYLVIAYMLCLPASLIISSLLTKTTPSLWRIVNIGVLSYIWGIFIARLHAPAPYYDIWQLYDLSRSFGSDAFYKMNLIRQAEYFSEYSTGFPPGYPALFALLDALTNMGLRGFVLINYGAFFVTSLLVRQISQRFGQGEKWGLFSLLIFTMPGMRGELEGGGTTIFSLLFILACFSLVSSEGFVRALDNRQGVNGRALLLGGLLGLGCMMRFDFLTFSLMGLMLWGFYCLFRRDVLPFAAAIVAFLCCVSPWICYSLSHFNHPFVMDNSRRIWSVATMSPGSYFPDKEVIQTLFTHPYEWVMVKTNIAKGMALELLQFIKQNLILLLLPLLAACLLMCKCASKLPRAFHYAGGIVVFMCLAYLPLLFLVGYRNNERYYIPMFAVMCLLSAIIVATSLKHNRLSRVSVIVAVCVLAPIWMGQADWVSVKSEYRKLRSLPAPLSLQLETMTDEERALRDYIVKNHGSDSRILFNIRDYLQQKPVYAARFASQSGLVIMQVPSSMATINDYGRFIEQYRLNLLWCKDEQKINDICQGAARDGYRIVASPYPQLYTIER